MNSRFALPACGDEDFRTKFEENTLDDGLFLQEHCGSDHQYLDSSIPTALDVGGLLQTNSSDPDHFDSEIGRLWHVSLPTLESVGSLPLDDDDKSSAVSRSSKGLSFDLDRITDEKFRDRILRNRASAERSRQKRKGKLKGMEEMTMQLEDECAGLRQENGALRQQLEVLQVFAR